jgi:hypothetical protein
LPRNRLRKRKASGARPAHNEFELVESPRIGRLMIRPTISLALTASMKVKWCNY